MKDWEAEARSTVSEEGKDQSAVPNLDLVKVRVRKYGRK